MKAILTFMFMSVIITLSSITWTVKQDGSGHVTEIQLAITICSNGDTILVYPGTYYENIDYSGKNVTIGSLEMITGNPAYRDSTIIDGNNNGPCVWVRTHESNAGIYGFTIQHGSGLSYLQNGAMVSLGGGIYLRYATYFSISNCLITNNTASSGGGIHLSDSTISMKNTKIIYNYASGAGGGILFSNNSNCIFDSAQRCSIYENCAGRMNDIGAEEAGHVINLILDTFTINPPTAYYANFVYTGSASAGHFTYNILHAYRTEINHDLYVSPVGSDDNDGLTPQQPLKTITKALHSIASDSLDIKTIYLAPGIYSSADGQLFPLSMKSYVKLIGDTLNPPVILNQYYKYTLIGYYAPSVTVRNLIFEHGNFQPTSVFGFATCTNTKVSNITINPVHAISYAGIFLYHGKYDLDNIRLNGLISNSLSGICFFSAYGSARNISMNDCHTIGNEDLPTFDIIYARLDSTLVLENISVTNCSVISPDASVIDIIPNPYLDRPINPTLRMTNLLVTNNSSGSQSPFWIDLNSDNTSTISNCTFVNNSGGSNILKISGRVYISNCLFSNNGNTEVNIRNTQIANYTSTINFYNNMILGYPNSVYVHSSNQVTFNEFNFSANPSFAGTDITNPLSYMLNYNSPCINAGTQDTTGLYLPATDYFGNARIYNGIIDIGCHEWNGTAYPDEEIPVIAAKTMTIYPNPFKQCTTIGYHLEQTTEVLLEVYNTKGQRVKKLLNTRQTKGEQIILWDGKDEAGRECSTGIYLIKCSEGNSHKETGKVTLIKH